MKKTFLFGHHAKSREDCNKFSRSVSSETLVVGTTTVGSADEQTQRLSKCSAGYRFCKTMRFLYKNLVDYLLQTSPVFKLVKIFSLVVVLSLANVSESRAEVHSDNCDKITDLGGYMYTERGTNCKWSITDEGVLIIERKDTTAGTGSTGVYSYGAPWGKYINQIKAVVLDGVSTPPSPYGFNHDRYSSVLLLKTNGGAYGEPNIDSSAVENCNTDLNTCLLAHNLGCISGYTLKDGRCVCNLSKKGQCINSADGCGDWYKEESGVCIPDYETDEAGNIIIDDDSPEITEDIFGLSTILPENARIVCRGDMEKCKDLLKNYPKYYDITDSYGNKTGGYYAPIDMSNLVKPASETNCESGRYYWSGASCNNKKNGINCDENWKQIETWCNHIRYTPAEAAKVLKDTDNEIIMTFKVNR